jgi:hypothetical protein
MALMMRKIMANRRLQHEKVTAHKRRLRDEVMPKLRQTKLDWFNASRKNKQDIQKKWNSQKALVQGQQNAIINHKRRIRSEIAKRM